MSGSRCTLWADSPEIAILEATISVATLLVPLHVAADTESLAAAWNLTFPRFFSRVRVGVYLE
jgi:hypothetical protein